MTKALRDPDPRCRAWAAYAAGQISGDVAKYLPAVRRQLWATGLPPDTGERLRETSYIPAEVFEAWAGEAPDLIVAVAETLPTMYVGPLRHVLKGIERAGPKVNSAVPGLLRLLDRKPVRPTEGWSEEEDVVAVCGALAAIGPAARDAVPKLRVLANHPYPEIAAAAAHAADRIEGR